MGYNRGSILKFNHKIQQEIRIYDPIPILRPDLITVCYFCESLKLKSMQVICSILLHWVFLQIVGLRLGLESVFLHVALDEGILKNASDYHLIQCRMERKESRI